LPAFSRNVEEQLTFSFFTSPVLFIGFILLTLIIGLLAGSFPSMYIARFQPFQLIRNDFIQQGRKLGYKNILMIIQLLLSLILIDQTMLVKYQLTYLMNMDAGFIKKDMLVLPVFDKNILQLLPLLKKNLKDQPGVLEITAVSDLPGFNIPRGSKIPEGYKKNEFQLMDEINVDDHFIPALGIELIAGRNFSEEYPTDQKSSIIINQLAARKFGWKDPIGKTIQFAISEDRYATGTVIGMVKDFHLSSMHRVIEPLFISNAPEPLHHILIRMRSDKVSETLSIIERQWNSIYPGYPFQFTFLENKYDQYLRTIEKVVEILSFFSILAIILAFTGIFSLSTFMAILYKKEIGIRKTFGDTTRGILFRFCKNLIFQSLVTTILLYIPYAYFTRDLLQGFLPYATRTNYLVHIKAIVMVILVALLAVAFQSVKSAVANPVDLLKQE
jgi:putative ABC transport system permease protein